MKRIKDVLIFEYLLIVKSKSFLITTALLVIMCVAANVVPAVFSSFQKNAENTVTNKEEVNKAAYIDVFGEFSQQLLSDYFPDLDWVRLDASQYEQMKDMTASGEYVYGIRFNGGLSYDFVTVSDPETQIYEFNNMVKEVYQKKMLEEEGFDAQKTEQFISVSAAPNLISLSNGKGGEDSDIYGYLLSVAALMVIFMPLVIYGKYIAMSVVNEKASRTVEVLFTCAKPSDIIFGKVFGVGLAVLTQGVVVVASLVISVITINGSTMAAPALEVLQTVGGSVYVCVFLFFIFAFFTYLFLFAGFGATSKEPQDVNNIILIPTLLCLAGFYISMFFSEQSLFSGYGSEVVKICSFIPFLSPLVMTSRVFLSDVPFYEISFSILINTLTLVFAGIISATIYKKYIMMYGKKITLLSLFQK